MKKIINFVILFLVLCFNPGCKKENEIEFGTSIYEVRIKLRELGCTTFNSNFAFYTDNHKDYLFIFNGSDVESLTVSNHRKFKEANLKKVLPYKMDIQESIELLGVPSDYNMKDDKFIYKTNDGYYYTLFYKKAYDGRWLVGHHYYCLGFPKDGGIYYSNGNEYNSKYFY